MKPFTKVPRVLLTNDDGFDAPGLAVLLKIAIELANEVWVVAPQLDQSGVGQSLSLNQPLRIQPRGERQWSVSGTPADCVIMGLSYFMKDKKPTYVLSGVNAGANTGDDINLSGTLGAAFTGLMLNVPSIGISLDCLSRKNIRWQTAETVLPQILKHFFTEGWPLESCLSINIPDLKPEQISNLTWTQPAAKTIPSYIVNQREDLREKDYFWIYPGNDEAKAFPRSDVDALTRGEISVTALKLDRSISVDKPAVLLTHE